MEFKRDKYIEVLIYLIAKTMSKKNVGKTVLANLLYFVDFDYYELYGESLTGERYFKTINGLKPKHFDDILIDLIQRDIIYLKRESYYDNNLKKYFIVKIPDNRFSKKEYFVIRDVLDRFSDKSATKLNYIISRDYPFKHALLDEEINYECVFHRENDYSVRKE